jgi:hypothetical protein
VTERDRSRHEGGWEGGGGSTGHKQRSETDTREKCFGSVNISFGPGYADVILNPDPTSTFFGQLRNILYMVSNRKFKSSNTRKYLTFV